MTQSTTSDSTWQLAATHIDPSNYFGVTVANGMVGLVSSAQPMQVQDVILNGVYDNYQRGRVENILKVFNHLNFLARCRWAAGVGEKHPQLRPNPRHEDRYAGYNV